MEPTSDAMLDIPESGRMVGRRPPVQVPLGPNSPPKYLPPPSCLTVVETVYHQSSGGSPAAVESRFSRVLASEEQPYGRTVKLTEAWVKLDTGWIAVQEGVSHLVIQNLEGRNLQLIPTEEEKEQLSTRVVEVGLSPLVGGKELEPTVMMVVLPGESARFRPHDVTRLYVRCKPGGETARATLTVYPA